MRKSLREELKANQERTAKWRAERTAKGVPEARQVDKVVLMALVVASDGFKKVIDRALLETALKDAFSYLALRYDREESVKAVRKRIRHFRKSGDMRAILGRGQ